jgi:hypothetical protein
VPSDESFGSVTRRKTGRVRVKSAKHEPATAGGSRMSGTDCASERRSENRPALQRRYSKSKTKKGSPVPEGRGEAARKLLFSTKDREAWSLFLSKAGCWGHLQAQRLTPISANLRSAALTNALRFLLRLTPALRDGVDLESSVTGAEAPAYYQAVPPGRYV